MRYFKIPKKITIHNSRASDGSPLKMSFAEYFDLFVSIWRGWRSQPGARAVAESIFDKFAEAGEYTPTFNVKGDGNCNGATHTLVEGKVLEFTDAEHEQLCAAIDGCDIPAHLTMPLTRFANLVHNAPKEDPRVADKSEPATPPS